MSDVSKIRRSGGSPLPIIRKSADPFQPELGEMDFSQQLEEVDEIYSTTVQSSQEIEETAIRDDDEHNRREKKKKRKKYKEEESPPIPDEESLVDLKV
jgi:hypothetical protein